MSLANRYKFAINKIHIELLVIMMLVPISAFCQNSSGVDREWRFSISAGAVYAAKYFGDDERQISTVPVINIAYKDKFFVSLAEGVGYNIISTKNWKVGPVAKYNFGRKENGDNILGIGDGTSDLSGLGNVDATVELGTYIKYSFKPIGIKVVMRKSISGHEGLVGEASVEYANMAYVYGLPLIYALAPKLMYTDSNYNRAFFGVNATQSVASGLSVYDANRHTLSYGIGCRLIVPQSKNISTIIFADYLRLGDEIANSSLILQRGSDFQSTIGLLVNYNF